MERVWEEKKRIEVRRGVKGGGDGGERGEKDGRDKRLVRNARMG